MSPESPLQGFHPLVREWFQRNHETPTEVQTLAWPLIARGDDVLVIAPTGSGKTLTGFLGALSELYARAQSHDTQSSKSENAAESEPVTSSGVKVLYISPLKALSNDIEKNLGRPLAAIASLANERGDSAPSIRIGLRTGDTVAKERQAQFKVPPEILVSTPESLYVLLTSERGRKILETVSTVIVDEIHAIQRDKRGAHLALSLARLDGLISATGRVTPQRIGLSATQRPKERVLQFLIGNRPNSPRKASIVDTGHARPLDLDLVLPGAPLAPVLSHDVWEEIYDSLAKNILEHRTTLLFSNTRRQAERVTRHLAKRLGTDAVTSHHGSLSKELRLDAEQRLKSGQLRALVATASMELGIDVGEVELVCQLGSPRSIASLLQRVGRSGHHVGGTPKGRIYPLSRNDLAECVALLDAVRRGELDVLPERTGPLDILVQQLAAEVSTKSYPEDELFELVRSSAPYSSLERETFDRLIAMMVSGFVSARGPRAALLHRDPIGRIVHARRGTRLTALLGGGAIPENFEYEVLLSPSDTKVGSLHEDFAIESSSGDIFQLGNRSYQILKIEPGTVRVSDAGNTPPNLPFWLGEAPSRTDELSFSVSRLREMKGTSPKSSYAELLSELGLSKRAYEELDEYVDATQRALGVLPTQSRLVAERFFDETGGMHVVVHSPYGARLNRAFGLALRKRFCRTFNVELQAAADDDALLLSLGPMHSFPLDELPHFLHSASAKVALEQALLDAPLFATRFRQNATRALSVSRYRGGRKVPPRFQRMEADDLLAHCFPDQVACLENLSGPRLIPDHPLVEQTMSDCLTDAMDEEGLLRLLQRLEAGEVSFLTREASEPSPLAAEILNARPYAFLDDAPLEERRSQAVQRGARLQEVRNTGLISPSAIEQVLREVALDVRNAEEVCERLYVHGFLTESELRNAGATEFLQPLLAAERVQFVRGKTETLWFAGERATEMRELAPGTLMRSRAERTPELSALREILRGRLTLLGPTTPGEISSELDCESAEVLSALALLEAEGFALSGRFRSQDELEYCDRRLLRRIHAYGRQEQQKRSEPVSISAYLRFLLDHQGLTESTQRQGSAGIMAVLEQLTGFAAPFSDWETHILPARIRGFVSAELDMLGWSGELAWGAAHRTGRGPLSTISFTFCPRRESRHWLGDLPGRSALGSDEQQVEKLLSERGAVFLAEVAREVRLLPSAFDEAIKGLLSRGLITFDVPTTLRHWLQKSSKRRARTTPGFRGAVAGGRVEWLGAKNIYEEATAREEAFTRIAMTYLHRYGVVFRGLLEKESGAPSYRDLLSVLYRLEARGEVRGGRFIAGVAGEQFALPSVAASLPHYREPRSEPRFHVIAASDPLNMLGVLLPKRERSSKGLLILRDGVPVGEKVGARVREFEPGGLSGYSPSHEGMTRGHPPSRVTRL